MLLPFSTDFMGHVALIKDLVGGDGENIEGDKREKRGERNENQTDHVWSIHSSR